MSATRKRNLKRAGLATIIAAIAALLIVASTGGGNKKPLVARTPKTPASTTPTTSTSTSPANAERATLTAAEYRRKANAICNALPNSPSPLGSTLQTAAPVLNRLVTDFDQAVAQLSELQPPPGLVNRVSHALALVRQEDDLVGNIAAAASGGDESQARAYANQLAGVMPQAAGAWRQIGAWQC